MGRSKPTSPEPRTTRTFALIQPYVRASPRPPEGDFELPIRMEIDHDGGSLHELSGTVDDQYGQSAINSHSTGSPVTSRTTTEPSTSSARLDGQRRLSTVLTPTTSEGTNSERGAVTSRATSNLVGTRHKVTRRRPSRATDLITASIDETLLGQGRWAPLQLEHEQDVEFVPGRPFPEPRLAAGSSPWSGFASNDDDPGGSAFPVERRGGRKGGFEKNKAVKVGEMRQIKACLRCLFYRIECDDGDPCSQCTRRMRTWKLPCTRQRLPERLCFLFPDILIKNLEFRRVYDFIGGNAENYLQGQDAFHLPLTQFLGEGKQRHLWLQVREAEPLGEQLMRRPGFLPVGEVSQMANRPSPPLIPFVQGDPKQVEEQVSHTLELWLRRFLDEEGSNWQWFVFAREVEEAWERNVLGQICRLLEPENEAHAKLEVAMELTFFNHLLTHSFAVPTDHVLWLYTQKLQHPDFKGKPPVGGAVCPRAVNMYLAMIVLKKVQLQAEATLEHINKLFAARDDSMLTGTLAFCESWLFMMVLAQLQRSVMERARMDSSGQENNTIDIQEARQLIRKMEDELATPIVELCVFKLRKVAKKRKSAGPVLDPQDSEAASDDAMKHFFNNLHRIRELCSTTLNYPAELGDIDENTFGVKNVQRLLKRLYDAVSPFFPPPGPSEAVLEPWPG